MDFIKARLSERSTALGLGALAVSAASLIFPEYSFAINAVASLFGLGAVAVPTGGRAS